MFSLRTHILISLGLLGAMIAMAAAGSALQASGVLHDPGALRWPAMILFFGLFAAFGFSVVPVIVKSVLGFQTRIGNDGLPAVRAATGAQSLIIWVMWLLMAAGLLVALPAAMADGFLGPGLQGARPVQWLSSTQGVLVARPGMTVAEMVRASTLKLDVTDPANAPTVSGGAVFSFRMPGSSLTFPGCRYYFVSTFTHDRSRIQALSIGLSPRKLTRAELDAANLELGRKLAADGWRAGHEVYRTAQDRQLHGGLSQGPDGRVWLKDGVVLNIETPRMDEPRPAEDAAAAGEWIQTLSIWGADDYPGFERLEFAKG